MYRAFLQRDEQASALSSSMFATCLERSPDQMVLQLPSPAPV